MLQGRGKQSSAFLHVRKRGILPVQENAETKKVHRGSVRSWKHELHFRVPVVVGDNGAGHGRGARHSHGGSVPKQGTTPSVLPKGQTNEQRPARGKAGKYG